MRFVISRIDLLNGLNIVSRAVSSKSPLPILTGIKFELTNEGLTLLGSDTDISIKTTIPTELNGNQLISIFDTGSIVLPSRFILDMIRKLEGDKVDIELVDGLLVKISDAKCSYSLKGIDANDYPPIDLKTTGSLITLKQQVLKDIISQTVFATSQKENRPMLTGVNFKINGNILECVATDTYRLAKKVITLSDASYFNITIPSRSLVEIGKILEDNKDIDIYITEKRVLFYLDKTAISSRVISGIYPDTSKLIPSNFNFKLDVSASALLSAIDRTSLLSSDKNNIIKLSMSKERVEVSSKTQEVGSAVERLNNFDFEGNRLEISFSAQYVQDAIRAIGSEDVQLFFISDMKPFIIKNKEDDSITQLVLPVRTY